ncbi:MAG: hypothetical protein VB144_08990 [Clostridia bacterium]|nr:hypothetical protein [Clostridia bacterium]
MTEKGPRRRTVCFLGNLAPRPLEEWLIPARKVEECREAGPAHVGNCFWDRLAIADLVEADLTCLNDDALYRNLDRLYACRGQIEKGLALRERDLFNLDATVYFYDLTSTYFEGQVVLPTADRGTLRIRRSSAPDPEHIRI